MKALEVICIFLIVVLGLQFVYNTCYIFAYVSTQQKFYCKNLCDNM